VVVVVAAEAPRRGGGSRESKTAERERGWCEWRGRGRGSAREEENALRGRKKMHCAHKEEEEEAAKGKSEIEGTRGGEEFVS